jgi:hypothetical protein
VRHVAARERHVVLFLVCRCDASLQAGSVIDMRLLKIARGGAQGAAESRLIIMEKVDAQFEAGSMLVEGGSAAELVEMTRGRRLSFQKRTPFLWPLFDVVQPDSVAGGH